MRTYLICSALQGHFVFCIVLQTQHLKMFALFFFILNVCILAHRLCFEQKVCHEFSGLTL